MFRTGFLPLALSLCLCGVSWNRLQVSATESSENILNASYHKPSPPVNLSLKSHNFKTVLTWTYVNKTSEATNFTVQFRDYQTAQWQLFPPCSNIALYHCDVTEAFSVNLSTSNSYYAKVKAITKFEESQFVLTERFSFQQNATIGAPTVDISVHGHKVVLRCIYPFVTKLTTATGRKVDHDLRCDICVWQEGHNELKNCATRKSKFKLNITQPKFTPCVSARVNSMQWEMKTEWSTQKCFQVQFLSLHEKILFGHVAAIAFFIGLITVSIIWIFVKKELVLPKSLMLIVKAIKPYADMKIEEDAVSVVIKCEDVCPVESNDFYEEVAKPISNPDVTEPLTVDLKYAGKGWPYDQPQTLLNIT
ncbi:interferon gamma receptor 1-like [Hemiscyllium ocellatum]|uniref:interferon gamma receptor 1-like n=1 Tax=Hemiscyllium ocellatum TaxID=170820 RepID=UPI002966ABB9|nr:interferon gamma receptor 1-like [Hemiscyllium ocellatum]